MAGCSVCDSDPKSCDVCTEEGAKFDEGQSKCIVEDDGEGGWPLLVMFQDYVCLKWLNYAWLQFVG